MDATGLNEYNTPDSGSPTDQWLSDTSNRSSTASTTVGSSRSPPQDPDQQQQTSRSRNKPPSPRIEMEQSENVPEEGVPDWRSKHKAYTSRLLRDGGANNRGTNIVNVDPAKDFPSNAAYRSNPFLDRLDGPPDLSYSGLESVAPLRRPKPNRVVSTTPRLPPSNRFSSAPAPVSIPHPWEHRAHRHVVVPRQQVHFIDRIQSLARHGVQFNPDGGITVYFCPDACCRALCDVVGLSTERSPSVH